MKAVSIALFAGIAGSAFVQPVLAADATKLKEKVLHSFGSGADGEYPEAGVIDVNGTLYGTTDDGGTRDDSGTVFSVNPNTGTETVVYSFGGGTGVFPVVGLIDVNGTLYGTTLGGGSVGYGTAFSVNPDTGAERVLHSFGVDTDGEYPEASLIDVKGTLYGTTWEGGNPGCELSGCGTVFSVNPQTGAETVVYSFCSQQNCADGEAPYAGLIDVKGTLYSTTSQGGTYGEGMVFSVNPATGAETVVYSFCSQQNCSDGAEPDGGLIDVKGTLYGTTLYGGNVEDDGTVFALDLNTGKETVLYSFCSQQSCADGETPDASLINVKGTLYGTVALMAMERCLRSRSADRRASHAPAAGSLERLLPLMRSEFRAPAQASESPDRMEL